ncbi:M28 family peptidase [Candidatus Woesearchaeota archaeon]|nr:M28 family peptidase [Candidatus Woesearchaeota archaeon]
MNVKQYVRPFVGKGFPGRQRAVLEILAQLGIPYSVFAYRHEREEHYNYVFTLGAKEPGILLCAHYDAYPGSPGANDDASGIAVLFALYQRLRRKRLSGKVTFALFDQEEIGCIGSTAYAAKKRFSAVVSLELVGMGDVVGLWPLSKLLQKQPFFRSVVSVMESMAIPYETAGDMPLFYADFTPFRARGIRDSFCMTMIPRKDVSLIREALKRPAVLRLRLETGIGLPVFFQHYHSTEDNLQVIQEAALARVVTVLDAAILKNSKL